MIRFFKNLLILSFIFLRELFFKLRYLSGKIRIKSRILLGDKFLQTYKQKIPIKKIKKIIVFRTDRIGDLILTTPALENLRNNFKKAVIDIVVNSYIHPLLIKNPHINTIINKDDYSAKNLIKYLKKQEYDLAIILFSNIKDKKIAFNSKIPFRIGSNRDGGAYLLTHHIKDTRKNLVHEVEACFDIIKILNIPIKKRPLTLKSDQIYKTKIEKVFKKHKLKKKNYIIVHPYSRDYKMRWTEENYKTLLHKLSSLKKYKSVIIGSSKELILTKKLIKNISPKPINLSGIFSLGELIYFTQYAKLFIGNSTGTMHIANALNVPVITMFGSRYIRHHFKRWYPWNKGGYYFTANDNCRSCTPWNCNIECMKSITPDNVYKKAIKIIS